MGQAQGQPARSARCIALVGPYLSGKTTLLEALLARTGAIGRQGTTAYQNTVGDASDDRLGDVDVELRGREIIEEEERPRPHRGDVVHAHRHEIDADGVMHPGRERDLELRPDAVGPAHQDRVDEPRRQPAEAGEAAHVRDHLRDARRLGEPGDAFDRAVAWWKSMTSDRDAVYDDDVEIKAGELTPVLGGELMLLVPPVRQVLSPLAWTVTISE